MGLFNLHGSTCYASSIFQALCRTPAPAMFRRGQSPIFRAIDSLLTRLAQGITDLRYIQDTVLKDLHFSPPNGGQQVCRASFHHLTVGWNTSTHRNLHNTSDGNTSPIPPPPILPPRIPPPLMTSPPPMSPPPIPPAPTPPPPIPPPIKTHHPLFGPSTTKTPNTKTSTHCDCMLFMIQLLTFCAAQDAADFFRHVLQTLRADNAWSESSFDCFQRREEQRITCSSCQRTSTKTFKEPILFCTLPNAVPCGIRP